MISKLLSLLTVLAVASCGAPAPAFASETLVKTTSGNIVCDLKSDAIVCVDENQNGFSCSENGCEYDETGELEFTQDAIPVQNFVVIKRRIRCEFTETNVRCRVGNSEAYYIGNDLYIK